MLPPERCQTLPANYNSRGEAGTGETPKTNHGIRAPATICPPQRKVEARREHYRVDQKVKRTLVPGYLCTLEIRERPHPEVKMSDPVTIGIAAISAGSAVIGAVNATTNSVEGETGVHVSACNIHFPREFPPDQYAEARQQFNRDIVKFTAFGFWNNNLAVSATGYISDDDSPVAGRPTSSHPNTPVNRFIVLTFQESPYSEDMSRGLLTVNIELWGGASDLQAEGTPEDPWIPLHVHGRLDPVGIGDIRYGFKLDINTHGHIRLSNETLTGTYFDHHPGTGTRITNEGDHVLVWMS